MPSPPAPDIQRPRECHGQAESPELDRVDHGGPSNPQNPVNDLLLRAARGERTERTPVWLMRQAGRFDPNYREIRRECGLELEELFRDPQLAAQITVLPLRLGVDAAILFQDILTPLSPLGAHFIFRPGPILREPIRTRDHIERLTLYDPAEEMPFIARSIELTLDRLAGSIPLLGFAGAPLTLAAFLIEGGSPGIDPTNIKALVRDDPDSCHRLLDKLADMTIAYLRLQIDSGVHAIQLFESVGDLFTEDEYERFAVPYQMRIMKALAGTVPRILFVKENSRLDLMARTGADVLSVGRCIDLRQARQTLGDTIALQGNVDNEILRSGSFDQIERAVRDCLDAGAGRGHILNLNHGVFKDTPFENVKHFIETARSHFHKADKMNGEC